MKQIFLFECKKTLKKTGTWTACLLTVLSVIGLYFFNNSVVQDIRQGKTARLENNIVSFKKFKNDAEREKEKIEKTGENATIEAREMEIQHFQEKLEIYQKMKMNFANDNWKDIYQEYINTIQPSLLQHSLNSPISIEEQPISWFTLRATLAEMEEIKKRNVEPFIQNTIYTPYLSTIYDEFTGSSIKKWEADTRRYGVSGLYFLYEIIQYLYIPTIILLGCFIFGNNISSERGYKNRSINFYYVQPISLKKLFIAKYFSGLFYTVCFVLIMLSIPFMCGLVTHGLGDANYPVLVYDGGVANSFGQEFAVLNPTNDQFHFIGLGSYIGQSILLSIALVTFLYTLYFLLSLVLKNQNVTIILLLIVTFIGMKIAIPFNPFTYIDVHKVLTKELATLNFDQGINLVNGLLSLLTISNILIFILFKLFNRVRA
ncbi:DUF4200 domain-containing protein [Bacillus sp. B-jedd]|uniref:DUF4200 domain-containing protein n=1 Tax=Bacillus sp. B-jedd TaxID=1476857 RepID=UPI00051561E7|nr:DUF4200 domain-containing protein [Bacillus sp. B-jedd]CEG26221.1 ABC-2 family transporter protein [Bacillus sp. B-jedd]